MSFNRVIVCRFLLNHVALFVVVSLLSLCRGTSFIALSLACTIFFNNRHNGHNMDVALFSVFFLRLSCKGVFEIVCTLDKSHIAYLFSIFFHRSSPLCPK